MADALGVLSYDFYQGNHLSMLRKYLIQKYVDVKNVEELLGHSSFTYLRGILLYSVLLFLIYVGYAIWHQHVPEPYVKWVIGVLGLLIFARWIVSLLNLYLDCLLLSKDTLTVFLWDGILEYRTEVLDWSKINVISYHQNSAWDRILSKGDIVLQLGNVDFTFNDVAHPKKVASRLLLFKKRYEEEQKIQIEKDLEGDQRKFDVLVDALGDVIKEYMEQKHYNEESDDEDEF
ncbi:MAG: hypothetical protein LBH96_05710 [Candidatus Peribacteria bacterium]|nr:hypothetical protein [Candidatus Peribacteria bacterium]